MKAYQLKIVIKGSKPPILRRIMVPEKITFYQLHRTIQVAFCWDDYHLYEFLFPSEGIRVVDDIEETYAFDEMDLIGSEDPIDEPIKQTKKFNYMYDFGDDWEHVITVEKIISDYQFRYPR